jgi:antitoxin (DNA-binding transcriptional repressor) of toxin-antitoxin stability system
MEVTITQFRREIFDLVNQAMSGVDVWVTHKGNRFKVVPEGKPVSRLSRLTPMEIMNPNSPEEDETRMKEEMRAAWEKDWEDL